jgi:enoyl-CoA hydratase/carnithine racemase
MPNDRTPISVHARDDRVVVILDRVEVRNAIDLATVQALHDVCRLVEGQPRPLVITGAGGVFAAGADIGELRGRGRDDALRGINRSLFDRIARLPLPTIAAVDGPALGGGAELAYACDLRIASPSARFGNPEPGLGILAAAGAAYRLRELVGASVAKQVLLGGYLLDAEAALRHGLVAEIVPAERLLERAGELIEGMRRQAPLALRLTKAVVDAAGAHPLVDDLAQAVLFETDEKRVRMTAFLDRTTRGSEKADE